jgi:hypothetical protein
MGYIIDARFFRLGYTSKWSSAWVADGHKYNVYLNEDFIFSEFIKKTFLLEGVPHFTFTRHRWWNDALIKKPKEPRRDTFSLDNPFTRAGGDLLLSHICLNRKGRFMDIEIYLLDAELEDLRLNVDTEGTKTASTLLFETFFNIEFLTYNFKKLTNISEKKEYYEEFITEKSFNIFHKLLKKKDGKKPDLKLKLLTLKKLVGIYYHKQNILFYDNISHLVVKKQKKFLVQKDEIFEFDIEPIKQYFQIFKACLLLFEVFSKTTNKKSLFYVMLLRNCIEQLLNLCFFVEKDFKFIHKILFFKKQYLMDKFKDLNNNKNNKNIKNFFILHLKKFFIFLFKLYFSLIIREFSMKL